MVGVNIAVQTDVLSFHFIQHLARVVTTHVRQLFLVLNSPLVLLTSYVVSHSTKVKNIVVVLMKLDDSAKRGRAIRQYNSIKESSRVGFFFVYSGVRVV